MSQHTTGYQCRVGDSHNSNTETSGEARYADAISAVPNVLAVAISADELSKVWDLRDREFARFYKEFSTRENDLYDKYACVLYGKDNGENITSTARIVFDNAELGLPSDVHQKAILDQLRNSGKTLAELSKLAIAENAKQKTKLYIKSTYELASALDVSSVVMTVLASSASYYITATGATVLVSDIGYRFGIDKPFSLLEWDIKASKQPLQKFLKEELA